MIRIAILFMSVLAAFPDLLHGITTIHHDKPEESNIPKMATKMTTNPETVERHKRLLPYMNFYISNNQKFTPFLESNALPGPFIPIKPTQKYLPEPEKTSSPNYALIYDTLSQLKMRQRYHQNLRYFEPPRVKTVIETYTPTSIDIESDTRKYRPVPNDSRYKIYKPQVDYVLDRPLINYQPQPKPFFGDKIIYSKPQPQTETPVIYIETTPKPPQVNTIIDDKYVAQKIIPVQQYYNVPTENTNILAKILKQLQNSNALPQTLTTHNIDNSIKTLVKILNSLRKQQGLKTKPIVVVDENSSEEEIEEEEKPTYAPGTVTQTFPANTVDGGTPGRPGIDYPALSTIPQTSFNCKTQRYKGFFGDPHTNCQVWHYCDLNGGQASFLCPNGTIFSQVALTCDWWYNVKCSSTTQLYVLNERLYKYILPLAPKFPEDYSGPLVDRYLALKFQEMEEKMKNEKKKEEDKSEEKDDSDQLQDINNEKAKSEES
ncbi:uncharacterized protein LOC123008045 [Tribolium madens]|uniref:uncharacterized protein LOC123008045 n=1 Tax=Tribolium madens TaxID=41895 RepID=UPI001CF7427E|nr:uncharacterized protein LOC123008045 [Tribolium madens]